MARSTVTLVLTLLLTLALASTVPVYGADLDEATRDALAAALDDERQAQATYGAAAERYGAGPFGRIVDAEGRHERHLLDLYDAHGIEPPPDRWADAEIELPATVQEACAQAAQWEIDNGALFDDLLETVEAADVREVFQLLQSRSRDRHLPAFQRCAEGGAGGGMGYGRGAGKGQGPGMGQGRDRCYRHGAGAGAGQGAGRGQGRAGDDTVRGSKGGACCGGCGHGHGGGEGCGCRRGAPPAVD